MKSQGKRPRWRLQKRPKLSPDKKRPKLRPDKRRQKYKKLFKLRNSKR